METLFPDGEGVWYIYDALGRTSSKTTFNAQQKSAFLLPDSTINIGTYIWLESPLR